MRGRATGSPELEKAADYIAGQFRSFGLQPIDGKSYFQAFNVTTNARLGRGNHFASVESGKTIALKSGDDFIPFNFSSRGKALGQRGLRRLRHHRAGIQLRRLRRASTSKDKIVLILRHEPQEFDEKSVFDGKVYTEHAQFFSKATNAKMHGARGVILINDTSNHRGESDRTGEIRRAPRARPTPAFRSCRSRPRWRRAGSRDAGKNLDEMQRGIDKDLKPRSFAFPASLQVRARPWTSSAW